MDIRKMEGLFLPQEILSEVLAAPHRAKLLIGCHVDKYDNTISFWNGELKKFTVPFSFFEPSGTTKPNFFNVSIIDYGQTIKLGDYEAASGCVINQ